MESQQIIHELKNTLTSLEEIEQQYFSCLEKKHQINYDIEKKQHRLTHGGKIDGKNADIRKAQKWLFTEDLQEKKRNLEAEENLLYAKYMHLQRQLTTLQTIAHLMVTEKELSKIMFTFK